MVRSSLQVFLAVWMTSVPVLLAEEGGWEKKTDETGRTVQSLKIEAPAMTEEDQYGYNMPDRYKCDSCKAVMYHVNEDLQKKQPKSRRLKQWEYTDIFEHTCQNAFQGYGIKLLNGENVLSGPGLKDADVAFAPGSGAIQMGGESWTKRLGEICRKIIFEKVGEDETYDIFYKNSQSEEKTAFDGKAFCTKTVGHCTEGPKAPPKPKDSEDTKPKAKKDKAKEKEPRKMKETKSPEKPSKAGTGKMDVQEFLRSMAQKHGMPSDAYLTPRAEAEWEKTILALAGTFSKRTEL